MGSVNPVWANAYGYAAMWRDIRLTHAPAYKLRVLLKHPGWRPDAAALALPLPTCDVTRFERFALPLPPALALHTLLQLAVHGWAWCAMRGAAGAAAVWAGLIARGHPAR